MTRRSAVLVAIGAFTVLSTAPVAQQSAPNTTPAWDARFRALPQPSRIPIPTKRRLGRRERRMARGNRASAARRA